MSRSLTAALLVSLLFSACAQTPTTPTHQVRLVKETTAMISTVSVSSQITAEQALTRLLELIRTTRTVSEITPERLETAMGTKIVFANDGAQRYGYGAQLTDDWNLGFGVDATASSGPVFQLDFNPLPPGASPNMTDICQLDMAMFSSRLESMGFSKSPYRAEHGRLLYYTFDRVRDGALEMRIEVYPQGEANDPTKAGHECVAMMRIF